MQSFSSKLSSKLCVLYLALNPCIWFASFRLGPIKNIIIVLLALFAIPMIAKAPRKAVYTFIITLIFVGLNFYYSPPTQDNTIFLFGILENFLMFILGYTLLQKNDISNKMLLWVLSMVVIGSLLAISNYFFNIPGWYSPAQTMNYSNLAQYGYTMYPMWSTGLSFDRNGWGCSLSLLLPLCFAMNTHKKYPYVVYGIIFTSLFLCANRNGLLATLVVLYMYIMSNSQSSTRKIFIIFITVVGALIILGSSIFLSMMRFDTEDISSGRMEQYLLIPKMISEMGFWGLGHNATAEFINHEGLGTHMLHNTYFKILVEYGWLLGFVFFRIVIDIINKIRFALKTDNKYLRIAAYILIAGLLTGLFEPMTVFGVYGGYAMFWICYGYLTYTYKYGYIKQ